jgi:nitrile hydratase
MAAPNDPSVDRRGFLRGAAASAAAFAANPQVSVAHDHEQEHEHDHQVVPADIALRVKAIESLLVDKGLVDRAALDLVVDAFETKIGPRNGARVVARAWVDPAYKTRLLANPAPAIAELGFSKHQDEDMVVVENTPTVHNLVVCTLCSCYPWPLLGLPPIWYKSAPYRSRAVIDPRGVLKDFGIQLDDSVEVRVWDSTAEIRYLVLPERPAGSAHLNEEELAALVTRDSMIGTAMVSLAARREDQ